MFHVCYNTATLFYLTNIFITSCRLTYETLPTQHCLTRPMVWRREVANDNGQIK